jgi:hypothetical protein
MVSLEDDVQTLRRLNETKILHNVVMLRLLSLILVSKHQKFSTYVEVLQQVNLGLDECQFDTKTYYAMPRTSIIRSSLLGRSAILICLTATASPVPQLNAL